jgi:single-stranded-DNA-specific exonuclease
MTTRNLLVWNEPHPVDVPPDLSWEVGGHPIIAQILSRRGYDTPQTAQAFLHAEDYSPTPPEALPDLARAADYLVEALHAQQTVLVWGDFDVDGQTATALLVSGLRGLGMPVKFYIPDRLRESHGIRLPSLEAQIAAVQPSILLTCDTGISAHVAIDYTKARGIVTLITDHHDLPAQLPDADAVVDPKRLPGDHPLATLPGVGVAYKLIEELYTRLGRADELGQFLDLVALGIVADVAVQTRDTRYLLQIGLDRLRDTQRTGLRAMFETAQLDATRLTATDIAFQIGPRLNAAGRIGSALPAVELLTTTDQGRARLLAAQLEGLNSQRRLLNKQIYGAAQEQIARDPSLLDWEALVLAHPAWHAGVIGIVAGQLADYHQRPVVLLSVGDDGRARGSARSAPGYDIGAAIAAQADLLIEHGGHPGAAGLSLLENNIPAFRRRLSDTLRETRDLSVRPGLTLDAVLPLSDVTLELAADLNRLAPFGEGNPPILLATEELTLKSAAMVGRAREHRRLIVEDAAGNRRNVLWWNSAEQSLPEGLFDLAYQLEISTYQGDTELQLTLVDTRRSASAPIEVERSQREVIDQRRSPSPAGMPGARSTAIWAEGYRRAESPGLPLHELPEAEQLVIYTAPAGPYALQEALERVKPARVVLMGLNPPTLAFPDVQRRVLELVKFVMNRQAGQTSLSALAGAVAQLPDTIRQALDYTAARGEIDVEYTGEEGITITPANRPPSPDVEEKLAAFQAGVAETAAYRAFFERATPEQILGESE